MAGQEETGSEGKADPVAPFGTPQPLHRDKSVIEGEAVDITEPVAPVEAEAMAPATPEHPVEPELPFHPDEVAHHEPPPGGAIEEETTGAEPPLSPAPVQPARTRPSPIPYVIAALLGLASGFAGAYLARLLLDDTAKTAASLDQRLSPLDARISAAEKKSDAIMAGHMKTVGGFESRFAAVEKKAADALGLATAAQTAAQAGAQVPSQASAEAPAEAAAAAAPPAPVDLAPLQSRIDALDQHLNQLEATLNAPKTEVRAPQEPEAKPDPRIANGPAIAIVAESLTHKVASGGSFAPELAALDKLGADKDKLAPLQPLAAKGVVTAQALADQFSALTPSLLATEKPAVEGSAFQRLLSHAEGLVKVRKIGDLSGDDLSARVARVKDALAHDDVDRALKEWAGFPEPAKSTAAAWAASAKSHADAIAAAKALSSDAVANLANEKS